jgi:hypothetical protein
MTRRLALLLAVAACGGGGAAPGGAPRPAVRRDANLVTADELAGRAGAGDNLYEALRSLRPAWFRVTPTRMGSTSSVVVYLDGRRLGSAEELRDIPTSAAREVRYYSPSEAQGRFGLGHLAGAIEVFQNR